MSAQQNMFHQVKMLFLIFFFNFSCFFFNFPSKTIANDLILPNFCVKSRLWSITSEVGQFLLLTYSIISNFKVANAQYKNQIEVSAVK